MKKIMILMVIFTISVLYGCGKRVKQLEEKQEIIRTIITEPTNTRLSIAEGEELGNADAPEKVRCYYEMNTCEELEQWMKSSETKEINEGAFIDIIELYQQQGYVLIPVLKGEKADIISVVSDLNGIRFSYSKPSISICVEPIETKEHEDSNKENISEFVREKYNVEFNVPYKEVNLDTGNTYISHYYTLEKIQLENEKKECVVDTRETVRGNKGLTISFFENGMYVDVTYFDNRENEFHISDLEKLVFEKLIFD